MEYRKTNRLDRPISCLGLGGGYLQQASESEIEETYRLAIDKGINFFDLCGGGGRIFAPFAKAIKGRREKVLFQLHLGAVYQGPDLEYGWSRDLNRIKATLEWEMGLLGTDYVDFLFLHCVDEMEDVKSIRENGILDFALSLKQQGVACHLGFSSHSPEVASSFLDLGLFDLFMFSINPAYDYEVGDELGLGTASERKRLFEKAERLGVGISVMKPFLGGQLLDGRSPFKKALSKAQCLSYCLDRPGVLTVLPGVRGKEDLLELLKLENATSREKDYSAISSLNATASGGCVYCHHCAPCPFGLDVALINKYHDLALGGDGIAAMHYQKLSKKASDCRHCGHCSSFCPFKSKPMERMAEIAEYFGH